VAVRVEGLGKKYRLGEREPYKTAREAIRKLVTGPAKRLSSRKRKRAGSDSEYLWALKDVSFEVPEGEVLGIIGRNGAGKSTLLKLLSRITEPTTGRAEIYGRVGSLLEVGTGFHPELTGRENVYLNGAILGMRKAEIDRKFDEIVEFAEVAKFLDTPVKRYSSGMYVRLAFSVAAHLEPEILVIDEVLAVGDLAFQKKCLGKMGDVASEGRTVLFVSHNMAAVENLCQSAVALEDGGIANRGRTEEVIAAYVDSMSDSQQADLRSVRGRMGNGKVRITGIRTCDDSGKPVTGVTIGQGCKIYLDYESQGDFTPSNTEVGLAFISVFGVKVVMFSNEVQGHSFERLPKKGTISCRIPSLPLAAGTYFIGASISSGGETNDWVDRAATFAVLESDFYDSGKLYAPGSTLFYLPHEWDVV